MHNQEDDEECISPTESVCSEVTSSSLSKRPLQRTRSFSEADTQAKIAERVRAALTAGESLREDNTHSMNVSGAGESFGEPSAKTPPRTAATASMNGSNSGCAAAAAPGGAAAATAHGKGDLMLEAMLADFEGSARGNPANPAHNSDSNEHHTFQSPNSSSTPSRQHQSFTSGAPVKGMGSGHSQLDSAVVRGRAAAANSAVVPPPKVVRFSDDPDAGDDAQFSPKHRTTAVKGILRGRLIAIAKLPPVHTDPRGRQDEMADSCGSFDGSMGASAMQLPDGSMSVVPASRRNTTGLPAHGALRKQHTKGKAIVRLVNGKFQVVKPQPSANTSGTNHTLGGPASVPQAAAVAHQAQVVASGGTMTRFDVMRQKSLGQ
jgi:hypothetical protein